LLLNVRSSVVVALLFCIASAVLSMFLDALTVVAVTVTVGIGYYEVYHRIASGKLYGVAHDTTVDEGVHPRHRETLEEFRAFLRSLMMHAAVGTAIGGVMTQVGEPQNLLIAAQAEWTFGEFFREVAPVSLPVAVAGLLTCWLVDRQRWFGYGTPLPESVRSVLDDYSRELAAKSSVRDWQVLIVQAAVAIVLVLALAFHLAAAGLIGLVVIVLATSFTGITEEHRIGKAFEAALPFTALLVVFLAIVAVIHEQHLFEPLIRPVLALEGRAQAGMLYLTTGALSAISDNVFVATVYITEIKGRAAQGSHFAVAIRGAGRGRQHGHQHPEHRDAERSGRVPVSADLDAGPVDPARIPAHGVDGAAVFRCDDVNRARALVWLK
jgi:NhaB family Na+:H+ antiporter